MLPSEVLKAAKSGNDDELYKSLLLNFGKRGDKAYRYLKERRVKKYRDLFVVVGKEEYVVEEGVCTCPDFAARSKCAHVIAVEVAKVTKQYDEIDPYYIDFLNRRK